MTEMGSEAILNILLKDLEKCDLKDIRNHASTLVDWLSEGRFPPCCSAYESLVDILLVIAGRSKESLRLEAAPEEPKNLAQQFWNLFRERLSANLRDWQDRLSKCSTVWRILSAREACEAFAVRRGLGPHIRVVCEYPLDSGRIDVAAVDVRKNEHPLVLFESELGRPNQSKAPWTNEFQKLCNPWAKATLRVLSGTFGTGEGPKLKDVLQQSLAHYEDAFKDGPQGPFLLAFGPESREKDPGQPWLAYYLSQTFELHELHSEPPLTLGM